MRREWSRAGRICAAAAFLVAPFLAHVALATGRYVAVAVVLSSLQAAIVASVLLRRWISGGAWVGAGLALALAVIGMFAVRGGLSLDSGFAHTLLYTTLFVVFAQSLRPGRQALLTVLAVRLAGPRTPEMTAYTRAATAAWAGFFLAQLVISALLLAFAPLPAWSLFVNVLDLPLVCLMFACEYAVRLHRFRDYPHVSIAATIRAFSGRAPAEPARHVR